MVTGAQQKTILVVDDDAMNREVMEAFLTSVDYAVLLANNGSRALKSAKNHLPDLIILDIKMPDMNGFEVCEALKKDPITQAIPVMIVTGFNSPEDFERGREVGASDFISRPFDGDDFIARVHKLLHAHS